ncbi:MerR family transcriptional regulator [Vagococcus xieshaowenii]|uniref:MerR family transcriptional regulator n=1 Tax=Vagococcus xieshaowenii TaxID=2562451 RepID=A0A4Z0DE66_9ENTE|nr:MerR family transcriptional regulator [Vagococcus xieshaowenii]QCA29229.1 MerR family transcriptional regulator [Vagococcus xieshaowenii]TFZ43258.1 MerR family transcriptional regulator [Vagococcus xieshaowenii]
MEYLIKEFAELTGVTARALRHYDEIGLLKPGYVNESGYRIYGHAEVERMQHLLFLKELGLPLKEIQKVLEDPSLDYLALLKEHRVSLLAKKAELDDLLRLVDDFIQEKEGAIEMSDRQKFEAFKKEVIDQDQIYGQEAREKYGELAVDLSKEQLLNLSEADYQTWQSNEAELLVLLKNNQTLLIPSDVAKTIFERHKAWISLAWGNYSKESHAGLAQLYTFTPDFIEYYDSRTFVGGTELLKEIILHYTSY